MKSVRTALALLALCAPVLAGDGDPAKPAPAPAPEKKPEVKKERKVDPAAMKALEKYQAIVHLPGGAGIKELTGKGGLEGETLGLNPKWSAAKGFDLDLILPDSAKEQIAASGKKEEDAIKAVKSKLLLFVGLNAAFEAPGKDWSHFDVSFKQTGDDQVVELTPFDDEADADSRTYTFGKDGLLKSNSVSPKVDPDDPQSAAMAGMSIEATWTFEKKGEKNLLTNRTLSIMGTEIGTAFGYFDGPNGSYLPKDITLSTPQGDQVFKFHDYTVDGKFIDATKAEEKKPAEKPAPKPADKPGDSPAAPAPK